VAARPPSTAYRVQKFIRRNQVVVAAASLVVLALVLGIVTSTWLAFRERAQRERAEAGKLLALAEAQLERDPTAALAYARASLELADTPEARRLAVKVLWRGPVARILPVKRMAGEAGVPHDRAPMLGGHAFSPDGRWLATVPRNSRQVLLFPRDGGLPRILPRQPEGSATRVLEFGPRSDLLITPGSGSSMRFWSLPELEAVRTVELGGLGSFGLVRGGRLLTFTNGGEESARVLRAWPLPAGDPEVLEAFTSPAGRWDVDPSGTLLAHSRDRTVLVSPLEPSGGAGERILGEAGDLVQDVAFAPGGDLVASLDQSGEVRVWSTAGTNIHLLHRFQGPRCRFSGTRFDPTGRLVSQMALGPGFLLWDLASPPNTEPRAVHHGIDDGWSSISFDPRGRWAVTDFGEGMIEFWPLETPWARTFKDVSSTIWSLGFTDDLRWLAICPLDEPARLWPLSAADGTSRDLVPEKPCACLVTHPARREIVVGTTDGDVLRYPVPEGAARTLPGGFAGKAQVIGLALDQEGRRVAAAPYTAGRGTADRTNRVLRVWDLEANAERVYSIAHLTDEDWESGNQGFGCDGHLYATLGTGRGRVMRLKLPEDPDGQISAETLIDAGSAWINLSGDGRFLLAHTSDTVATHNFRFERLFLFDLVAGTSHRITTHGDRLSHAAALDPSGRLLVTGNVDGIVRVGPLTDEEPHLLIGHEEMITTVAISSDGRWIASASDRSVRLWPMPDVTKPPLHTLAHDKLLGRLDTCTNLRAVRDETSSTGWALEVGPFPGWDAVPEW
jgi:WD40 repeat protein